MDFIISIIAKAPLAGQAKTRLIPALGVRSSAHLAQQLLQRTLRTALQAQTQSQSQSAGRGHTVSLELRRTPHEHPFWSQLAIPPQISTADQGEGDLGQRMYAAVAQGLERAEAVILIGTDCPGLDAAVLQQMMDALQEHDAVMVPALDGGYVALGLRRLHPSLFQGIAWSTASVAPSTLERLAQLGWSVQLLPPMADIDEPADLAQLPPDWMNQETVDLALNEAQQLLLFGGVYGNLAALQALHQEAQLRGIAPEHIVCTGDILAYCAQANECIDFIRQWGVNVIAGNCETAIAKQENDCGCGFGEGSVCETLSNDWYRFNLAQIDRARRHYLAALPGSISLTFAAQKWLVVHGSVENQSEFVFASNAQGALEKLDPAYRGVFAGHSGLPFSFEHAGRVWHNSGALGMPANDGTARVWFSTLRQEDDAVLLSHHALNYDVCATQSAMRQRGLNTPYLHSLSTGLWPSTDILPMTEKHNQGTALSPATLRVDR